MTAIRSSVFLGCACFVAFLFLHQSTSSAQITCDISGTAGLCSATCSITPLYLRCEQEQPNCIVRCPDQETDDALATVIISLLPVRIEGGQAEFFSENQERFLEDLNSIISQIQQAEFEPGFNPMSMLLVYGNVDGVFVYDSTVILYNDPLSNLDLTLIAGGGTNRMIALIQVHDSEIDRIRNEDFNRLIEGALESIDSRLN